MKQLIILFCCVTVFLLTDSPVYAKRKGEIGLKKNFATLAKTLGNKNTEKAKIISGPVNVELKRGKSPGKSWQIKLGETKFKVSIEDKAKIKLETVLARLEKVPPLYRRCFEIVSEEGKDGVAFYSSLDGAGAHGSQNYLNFIPNTGVPTVLHEAGHCMEQRARNTDSKILEKWKQAIETDKIAVSRYGNHATHEDQAEFAMVYAFCLDAGEKELKKLKDQSPQRYALWEKMLKLSKATK